MASADPEHPVRSDPEIIEVELIRLRVPLLSPHRSAQVLQHDRESIVVRLLSASGIRGAAECPTLAAPGYVTETTDEAWGVLRGELAPRWLSGSRTAAPGAPAASAAMADALLDLSLRDHGASLADHLAARDGRAGGAAPASSLEWCAVLADVEVDPHSAARWAGAAREAGASMVKLKFDDPARLRDLVDAVRGAVRDGVPGEGPTAARKPRGRALPGRPPLTADPLPVAADANGALTVAGSMAVDDLGLLYLEQPLRYGTAWATLRGLRDDMATPVALDESLRSPDALNDAMNAGALDVASVKPARMGGLAQAAASVRLCAARGIDCFVGGMFELGIGRAAALGVAAMGGCTLPTDLGPSNRYFPDDITEPIGTDAAGRVLVPTGLGIGRAPDEAVVDRFVVDRVHCPPRTRDSV